MQISDESLKEFIALYKAEFKKDISGEGALEMTIRLVNLYQVIMRPLPRERGDKAMPPLDDRREPGAAFPKVE